MPDMIDKATERQEKELNAAIQAARGDIQPRKPGECDICGGVVW